MSRRTPRRRSISRIFAWPALIALLSAAGLAMGLIGDGGWDVAAWLALAAPIAACRQLLRPAVGNRPPDRSGGQGAAGAPAGQL